MSYTRFLLLLSLGLLFALSAARPTQACSCGGGQTVLDAYQRATQVIVAKAVSVEKKDSNRKLAEGEQPSREAGDYSYGDIRATWMKVEKVFKGTLKVGDEIKFAQGGGGDCIWAFSEESVGQEYVFYLFNKEKEPKLWYAGTCGRSDTLRGAADDLLYLENMAQVKDKTRLSGTLKFYMPSLLDDEESTYQQLSGLKVLINGQSKAYELKTDKNGVYEIYDLPPGKYSVSLQIPDGMKVGYPDGSSVREEMANLVLDGTEIGATEAEATLDEKAAAKETKDAVMKAKEQFTEGFEVTLLAGNHAYLDMTYLVSNTLRGKVLDPNNNPLAGVRVAVLPKEGKVRTGYNLQSDSTNTDGSFEIDEVPPGSYVLVANERGIISSTEPFSAFYYPNVTERDKAAVITLGFGESEDDLILHVPSLAETVTIEGTLLFSDGKPVAEEQIIFTAASNKEGIDGDVRHTTDAQGRFSFKVLKGANGTLRGEMYTFSGEFEKCPKLEAIIKESGNRFYEAKTQEIRLEAERDFYNIELKFAFPSCKKEARQ